MCLAQYNLQSSTQGAKSGLEEVMGEAFDVKEKMCDDTYIKLCDMLKKRYQWCADLIEMLALPVGPYPGMRVGFSNWKKADQLDVKSRISDINDTMSELMRELEKIKLHPLGGEGMNGDIVVDEKVMTGKSNIPNTYSVVEHAGEPDDDEELVGTFEYQGTTYLRTEENVLYNFLGEQVGRLIETDDLMVVDFSYRLRHGSG